MTTLTAEQLARVKKEFESYDTNQDGTLTVEEFTEILERFLTDDTLKDLIRELDPNRDGIISYEEYLNDYIKDLNP